MFAGHIGVGLGLGAGARSRNVGVLVLAALWLDVVLWVLVLAGVEQVIVPPDYATKHYLTFVFPYSHGLAATGLWTVGAFALTYAFSSGTDRRTWSTLVGVAVASHYVLDALVHIPEMPLLGDASTKWGLSLWKHLPVALGLECAITLVGLALFLSGARLPRWKAVGITVVVVLVAAMTVAGQTVAPPPPSMHAAAVSSLISMLGVAALAGWLGR